MTIFVVETQKVLENIRRIKEAADGRTIYAVLKSDGYGFGLVWMARTLLEQGIRHFAVSELQDAVRLRELSESAGILLLNPVQSVRELYDAADLDITLTVSSSRQAEFISHFCQERGIFARAHVEVDTGMGRYGFLPTETEAIRRVYTQLPGIKATGIYTHVYNARSRKQTTDQITSFKNLLRDLKNARVDPGTVHMASSAVLFEYPEALFDAVRVGSAFTGRLITANRHGLQSAGVVESSVSEIRTLEKGRNIGYGGVFRVRRKTRTAVVPAGYLSGIGLERRAGLYGFRDFLLQTLCALKKLLRHERYYIRIGGANVPVLGRLGANHLIADVTGIDCGVGSTVIMDGNPMLCGNLIRVEHR